MSDAPVRRLAFELTEPFARQLLQSGRADGPEPGARDRALVAFGLAPVSLVAVVPAAAAAPGPASALPLGAQATTWMVGKSLAMGVLGSLVAMSLLQVAVGSFAQPAAAPSSSAAGTARPLATSAAVSSTAAVPTSAPAALTVTAPSLASSKPQRPPETLPAPIEAATSAPAVEPPPAGLLELEALARARRALASHEPARALSMLDDFERRFAVSSLAEEAAVLRIETLQSLGRTNEARVLAQRFLRERPSSIYRARVSPMMSAP